jgi:uncharacterized protein (TIGR02996 family)
MTTEAAFLDAIHAEPDEATHKLVFADWLEEHGDPRAELVRGIVGYQQILGAGVIAPGFRPFRLPVPARLVAAWLPSLNGLGTVAVAPTGLLEWHLTAPPTGAGGIIPEGPGWDWVTHLHLAVSSAAQIRAMLDPFPYRPLRIELSLSSVHPDSWAAARDTTLAQDKVLKRIACLNFAGQSVDDEIIARLLASPNLSDLEALDLGARQAGPRTLEVLASAPAGGRLRSLFLGYAPRDRAAFTRLLRSPWMPGLQALRLLVRADDGPLLRLLAGSAQAMGLRILELDQPGVGPLDLGMLSGAGFWPGLQALSLSVPGLTADGLRVLIDMLQGGQLQALRLARYRSSDVPRVLANCRYLSSLTHLSLGGEMPKVDPIRVLGESPNVQRLQTLDLRATEVTDRAVVGLADWPHAERLRYLRLFKSPLGDAGLRALAALPALRGLLGLDLAWATPTIEGLDALARSPHLGNLLHLVLAGTARSNEERATLPRLFPRVWSLAG